MKARRIYDVSMSIREDMISWPSDGPVRIQQLKSMADGDRLNLSRLDMSAHTGTHIDAPSHFVEGGGGIDTISPSLLIGPVLLVEIPGVREIGQRDLEKAAISPGVTRLLLKTDNAALLKGNRFVESYAHLTGNGARYLADREIKLIGIDYLSIAEFGKGDEVHRTLLTNGIVIIEGLDLRGVPAGMYLMAALPLKISGADGAPARVVLFSM